MAGAPLAAGMATVLLVRHGETAWNREGRIQGWAPTPLTERGHEQARGVAAHLAADHDVDRVVASDLRRTSETARPVARETGAPVSFDRGWRERSFGVFEGMLAADLFEAHPEYGVFETGYAAATETPENGESIVDARERVLDAWERLLADLDADGTVVVVTHGGPVMNLVGKLRGLDVVTQIREVRVENCSVTEIAVGSEPELVRVGEVVTDVPPQ